MTKSIYRHATSEESNLGATYVRVADGALFDYRGVCIEDTQTGKVAPLPLGDEVVDGPGSETNNQSGGEA